MALINQAPWMAAMEAQLAGLAVVNKLINRDVTAPRIHKELNSGWQVDKRILQTSAPFAWSEETMQAVMAASRSIPLDTGMNAWNLSTPSVFWWFEKPLPFWTLSEPLNTVGVRALGFGWIKTLNQSFGMPCHTWLDDPQGVYNILPSQTWEWHEGATLGEVLEATRKHHQRVYGPGGKWEKKTQISVDEFMRNTEGLSRFVLAGLAWLNQKILVSEDGHIERHRRKDFNRRTGQNISNVRVVHLRKTEYPQRESSGEETSENKVDWSCRWGVDGHWRNVACGPQRGDHRLTYIMPFVKGPSDKPFRVPAKKAFVVNR